MSSHRKVPTPRFGCRLPAGGKIFNLGMGRTGTTFFTGQMSMLGFMSHHNIAWHFRPTMLRMALQGERDREFMSGLRQLTKDHDVFADVPYSLDLIWPYLERLYPGAAYVLVERDELAWVHSLIRLMSVMLTTRSHGTPYEQWIFGLSHNMSVGGNSARHYNPRPHSRHTAFLQPLRVLCNESLRGHFFNVLREHSARVRAFFATLPQERSLILRTAELSNISRLATFLHCDLAQIPPPKAAASQSRAPSSASEQARETCRHFGL